MSPEIYQVLKNQKYNGGVLFELGINVASDTKNLLNIVRPTSYFAFEPDPCNLRILSPLVNQELIKIIPKAVSNFNGVANFYCSNARNCLGSSSSLLKPTGCLKYFPHITFPEVIQVEVTRLDKFCIENNVKTIDLIWMDIQGSELHAIQGLGDFLKRTRIIATDIFNGDELYEGMCNQDEFIEYLGNDWEVIFKANADLIMRNKING